MLVSVIIPVYNGEKYISETINSVLSQSYQPIEIIVVDDGSTDSTKSELEKLSGKVKYFYQNNSGQSTALNNGINFSSGQLISFIDADDLWIPDKTKYQVDIFNNHPEIDMVFGQLQQFISPELSEEFKKRKYCPTMPQPGMVKISLMIKRTSFLKVGYFSANYEIGEFIDWYRRAIDMGLVSIIMDKLLVYRRIHEHNMGINKIDKRNDIVRILKSTLEERRKK